MTLAGFAVVGFDDLTIYPRMLSTLSCDRAVAGIQRGVGSDGTRRRAERCPGGCGADRASCSAAGVVRRGWTAGDDRGAFALAVCAALVLSPIVWLHYLALLLVPLGVCYRTLRWPWLVPLALWLTPAQQSVEHPWGIAVAVVVVAVVAITTAIDGGGWNRTSDQPVMSGLL